MFVAACVFAAVVGGGLGWLQLEHGHAGPGAMAGKALSSKSSEPSPRTESLLTWCEGVAHSVMGEPSQHNVMHQHSAHLVRRLTHPCLNRTRTVLPARQSSTTTFLTRMDPSSGNTLIEVSSCEVVKIHDGT